MNCAALEWDKKIRDYVQCSGPNTIRMVRIIGLITVELPLCDNHREVFTEEMAKFGGHLDNAKRVKVIEGKP